GGWTETGSCTGSSAGDSGAGNATGIDTWDGSDGDPAEPAVGCSEFSAVQRLLLSPSCPLRSRS
ncbi:MAG: hypothetical protein LC721_12105, partial [Actinobacteria bacterium]|nr:hypothetical protein [Actinomycetota bacterium]